MVGRRFAALDSWRGLCALVVALHHFPFQSQVVGLQIVSNGYLFVDFFFVLSGFVISHAWRGNDPAGFVWRRIARLWPLHLTMLGAVLAFEALNYVITGSGFAGARDPGGLFLNSMLLHGIGDEPTWNIPSWTISVEMGLYLSFVAFLTTRTHWRVPIAVVTAAASLAILATASGDGMNATTDYGWARGLAGFYTGYVVRQLPRPPVGTTAEIAIVSVVIGFLSLPPGPLHFAAPIVFGVAVSIFASEGGVLSGMLRLTPFAALGRWSYSIYLTHYLVCLVIAAAVNQLGWSSGTGLLFAYPLVVIGISAMTYRFIELPGQRMAQSLRLGRA